MPGGELFRFSAQRRSGPSSFINRSGDRLSASTGTMAGDHLLMICGSVDIDDTFAFMGWDGWF